MARNKKTKNGAFNENETPFFIKPLTLALGKVEYSDGSTWYPLASESWVITNAPGTVTSIIAGNGLTGGTITSSGTISIASVGITPGSYNWPNSLTINAQGQVTGANAGNQPITSIISSSGLTVTTSNGQSLINIFNTSVTSGTYNWPASFSVNAIGQLTSVTASGSLPINRLSGYPSSSSVFLRGDGSWASPTSSSIDINTDTTGQLSISRLSGYPFSSNVFLRGDGVWASTTSSSIDINTDTTGQLNISRLNGYPGSSNAFLRGDGSWILPYINNLYIDGTVSLAGYGLTTSGNVNATTGSLIGNNLAAYNSSGINVQSPLYFTNLGTYPIGITDNSASSRIYFNNTNTSSFATGLIVQNNGIDAVEFGFNNVNNEGYVWASNSATLKFGTNFTKRIDIAGNSAKTTFYDGSTQCYIHPNSNYLTLRGANTYNSVFSTIFESNAGGETSSLVMNGDYMQFINPLDTLGFIFTDEDNSTMTSYVAYINGSGQFISSSKEQKHSLQRKEHKDYLDRLNQLNVYSYGLKYDILEDDSPQKKERKARKANELQVGFIAEEVLELFDNATNVYKPLDEKQQTNHTHTPSLAINYNKLLCYTILAIQELTNRVAFLEKNDVKSLS